VEGAIGGAEEGGGDDGDEAADEEDRPEDGRKAVGALEKAGAAVFGKCA